MTDPIRAAFLRQADICTAIGSPLTGRIVGTLAAVLDETSQTGACVLTWPGDPLADALPLRLTGALHALVRSGQDRGLAALYSAGDGDCAGELARVLVQHDATLLGWLGSAPQTNEVARSGVLWPGVMAVARRFGPRVELLELGASGGLNLNMDRYGYRLGGMTSGRAASAVQLAPDWTGAPPPSVAVNVVARRGVDLNPLDLTDPAVAETMLAYIWPDQPERLARAEAAIAILRQHPPQIDTGDGADWIEAQLARPQAEGVTRIIVHSIALQYFPRAGQARVAAAIKAAGTRADAARPLAWLAMEFAGAVSTTPALTLRCWPGDGAEEQLATVHPHGAEISWQGASG